MNIAQQITVFVKKPALKSAGIYTFANFFSKSIGFFLLFVYSNPVYLNVDENGLLSLLSGAIGMFVPFLSLGIVHSTSVEFFKLDKREFKDFFSTGFVLPVILMFIGTSILFFFRTDLKNSYRFPFSFTLIIPLIAFFTFCNELFVTLIRSNDEPKIYLKTALLRLAIEASLSIVLVVNFALRWKGRVIGMLSASIVLFLAALCYFKKKEYLFGRIRAKYIKGELIYAFPIIIFQAGSFCLFSSDKFFLSFFSNNNEVGIYGYACAFSTILSLGCTAVLNYMLPKIYQLLSAPMINYKQIRIYFLYYLSFAFIVLIGIITFTPFLYKHFINQKYFSGLNYLYLIATGYFFFNITYFFYAFILYKKQKGKLIILSVISILISLTSNYFFIKDFNALGAAISVCVSFLMVLIITLLFNKQEAKVIIVGGIFKNYDRLQ